MNIRIGYLSKGILYIKFKDKNLQIDYYNYFPNNVEYFPNYNGLYDTRNEWRRICKTLGAKTIKIPLINLSTRKDDTINLNMFCIRIDAYVKKILIKVLIFEFNNMNSNFLHIISLQS